MALRGVLRPGFVQVRVLDRKQSLEHYRDRVGLDLVSEPPDGRIYLKGYDEFDRHSVVLREADRPGLDLMGWKVDSDGTLTEFEHRLKDAGVEVSNIDPGELAGVGRRIAFTSPTGHRFDLYAEIESSGSGPMVKNPDLWREEPRGMRPIRFDHCLLYGPDVDATVRIFTDALDFSVTETCHDDRGSPLAVFLSCSNKPHDVAFIRHDEPGKLHHFAFFIEDWNDIGRAADIMTRYDIPIDIGPTRHGMTRGQTIYFFDPSGNRNEVYAGGYTYYPDHPVRRWSADQAGKGIFYYERALNDRFLKVVT